MMESLLATLEAHDPSLGCLRSYRLEAGTHLLRAWLVDRSMVASASTAGAFVAIVEATIQCEAT